MLWFILAAVIILCVTPFIIRDPYAGGEFVFLTLGIGLLVSFMMNFACMSINIDEYQSKPHYIANLQDGSEVSGSFFLGIGGVGEDMKYSFYAESSKGVYELKTVDNEDAKIAFTDGKPYYTNTCYKTKTSKWISVLSEDYCVSDDITFHVPKGSIKSEFKLDAK